MVFPTNVIDGRSQQTALFPVLVMRKQPVFRGDFLSQPPSFSTPYSANLLSSGLAQGEGAQLTSGACQAENTDLRIQ